MRRAAWRRKGAAAEWVQGFCLGRRERCADGGDDCTCDGADATELQNVNGQPHVIQVSAKVLNGIKRPHKTNCMSPFI